MGNTSDSVASRLRTFAPILWGNVVALVVVRFPAVQDFFVDFVGIDITSPASIAAAGAVLGGLLAAAWYEVFRRIEKHIPPWLTRTLGGSNAQPHYSDDSKE